MGFEIIALLLGFIALGQCVIIRKLKKEINLRDDKWLNKRYFRSITFISDQPTNNKKDDENENITDK